MQARIEIQFQVKDQPFNEISKEISNISKNPSNKSNYDDFNIIMSYYIWCSACFLHLIYIKRKLLLVTL